MNVMMSMVMITLCYLQQLKTEYYLLLEKLYV